MADFVEIMEKCNRMCKSHLNCRVCEMNALREAHDRKTCEELLMQHPKEVLQVVLAWAERNPEPEYPTWAEWLETFGLMDCETGNFSYTTAAQHIPAEICEKYNIKPKERVTDND